MKIEIYSDTICPWCFIGKRRLEAALAMRPDIVAEIVWRPFQLNPTMPPEGIDRVAYLTAKFGGAERAERNYSRIRAAGLEVGLRFKFGTIQKTPNTLLSHILIYFSKEFGCESLEVENLFRAYFIEGKDTGEPTVLCDIAERSGLDRSDAGAYLAGRDIRKRILREDERARRNGITGVPCTIIDKKYAVSGAQSPEIFVQVFDLARQEAAEPLDLHNVLAVD
jgi:predicted DsbA family dithiol-disulfide isomerase